MTENDKVQILFLAPEEVDEDDNLTAGAQFRLTRMAFALHTRRIVPQLVACPLLPDGQVLRTKTFLLGEMEALLGGRAIATIELHHPLLRNGRLDCIPCVPVDVFEAAGERARRQTIRNLMPSIRWLPSLRWRRRSSPSAAPPSRPRCVPGSATPC